MKEAADLDVYKAELRKNPAIFNPNFTPDLKLKSNESN